MFSGKVGRGNNIPGCFLEIFFDSLERFEFQSRIYNSFRRIVHLINQIRKRCFMAKCPVCNRENVTVYRCPECGEIRCNAYSPICQGSYGKPCGHMATWNCTCNNCGKAKYKEVAH